MNLFTFIKKISKVKINLALTFENIYHTEPSMSARTYPGPPKITTMESFATALNRF